MISTSFPSVAVVGAGPGGLATALLLAASGLRVHVYEAGPRVGGRSARISLDGTDQAGRAAQFHFDRGPTFFLMPYVLEEIFAAAGRRLSDYAQLHRLDPMYRLVMGRAGQEALTIDCTQDVGEMTRRLAQIDATDARAFATFLSDNRVKLRRFEPVLRKPFRSAIDLLDPAMLKAGPHLNPTKSVHSYLGGYFSNPYVKLALSFQTKYLGMSPFKCPSLFSILPFIEYEYGVWHVRGGLNQLMSAMATACVEMGVKISCNANVQSVEFDGPRATGLRLADDPGTLHRHDHVVLNADASWALKNLLPAQAQRRCGWTPKRLDSMAYSCSTYMLYAGLRTPPPALAHHTICISADYQRNIDQISRTGELSDDPSMYFCNPSHLDPTLAPSRCSSLYVLVPTPNLRDSSRAGVDWVQAGPRLRRAALDKLRDLAGVRESDIACEMQLTPLDWQAQQINFGATFNLAHGLGQMLHRRPQHELPGLQGLWLAGGGTHPGSGLPVIFLSAQIAAKMLCKRLGVGYAGDLLSPAPTRHRGAIAPEVVHANEPASV